MENEVGSFDENHEYVNMTDDRDVFSVKDDLSLSSRVAALPRLPEIPLFPIPLTYLQWVGKMLPRLLIKIQLNGYIPEIRQIASMLRPIAEHFIPEEYDGDIFKYIRLMQKARKTVKDILHGPYFELADIFERKMECEGLCTAPLIYLARDVTDGPPKKACLYSVAYWVNKRFMSWGFYLGLLGTFTLLISILSCCVYDPKSHEDDE